MLLSNSLKTWYLIATFALIGFKSTAQVLPKKHKKWHIDSLFSKPLSLIIVPTIQNAPETSWNFGAGVSYYFNTEKPFDTLTPTRLSSLVVQGTYSLKKQLFLESRWQIFTKNEQMLHRGNLSYTNFFDKFWGIGNASSSTNLNEFSFSRVQLQVNSLRQIKRNIFLGLGYQYSQFSNIDWFIKSDNFSPNLLVGNTGSLISGIGPSLVADFRDNPFSAKKGYFFELSALYYRNWLGSGYHFNEYLVDARKYISTFKNQVLAFQLFGNFMDGHVPFRELPRLGGPQIMRGYFNGRFTDKNLIVRQVEYRMPIWKPFACSFFASTGQVAGHINDFKVSGFKLAYGAGIRFLLNKKEHIYVRFDYARTSDADSGFYIRINDSF
ncbi:MAG: hypothetical protein EAZ26_13445 [Runella slithyformis]|nr:MAG: hypothetical protein EAZ26_13445 [Runella slithyformis]